MPKRGANIYKRKDGIWKAKYASVYADSYHPVKDKQIYAINHIHLVNNKNINVLPFDALVNRLTTYARI